MEDHATLDVPKTPPKLIVLLGQLPLKAILGKDKITENRGIFFDCPKFNCGAIATYNPGKVIRIRTSTTRLKLTLRRREISLQIRK